MSQGEMRELRKQVSILLDNPWTEMGANNE